MAKQIIYGIGKLILRDFRNPKKVIGFSDLQDLTIESTSSQEDITGGNRMFPIASFPTDKGITCSGTNATFNPEFTEYLEGSTPVVGENRMSDFMEVSIPDNGSVTLAHTPLTDSVVINGFTVTSTTNPTKGQYAVSGSKITFNEDDAGSVINIIYEYATSTETVEYSVTDASIAKPFSAEYLFDIYDEDSQVSHKGSIKIYKAQSTTGFSINPQHRAPFAPTFEFAARDAKRADGKLWTFLIDGVAVV